MYITDKTYDSCVSLVSRPEVGSPNTSVYRASGHTCSRSPWSVSVPRSTMSSVGGTPGPPRSSPVCWSGLRSCLSTLPLSLRSMVRSDRSTMSGHPVRSEPLKQDPHFLCPWGLRKGDVEVGFDSRLRIQPHSSLGDGSKRTGVRGGWWIRRTGVPRVRVRVGPFR